MTTQAEPVMTVKVVKGRLTQTIPLQLRFNNSAIDLTAKTVTCQLTWGNIGAITPGITIVNAEQGSFGLTLTQAQVDQITVTAAFVSLSIWNADNSLLAHGWFNVAIVKG